MRAEEESQAAFVDADVTNHETLENQLAFDALGFGARLKLLEPGARTVIELPR